MRSVFACRGEPKPGQIKTWFLSEVAKTSGTTASDPALRLGAPLLLASLALVACYAPARKSMRIDPVVALRQEYCYSPKRQRGGALEAHHCCAGSGRG
jgi:hypothetical protein